MKNPVAKLAGLATKITGNYSPKIWLIGDGRSGTTWLSEMLICSGGLKYYFEPFHPGFSEPLEGRKLFFDLDAKSEDPEFDRFARDVFQAKLNTGRAIQFDLARFPKGLLVKDIYAHLHVDRVLKNHPEIQPVLLMRHPGAVAASKIRYSDWNWKTDPEEFLNRESMREFLEPWKDLILRAETDFQKHVGVWCIVHRHLFDHVDHSNLVIVKHEELSADIDQVYKLAKKIRVPVNLEKLKARWNRPSKSVKKVRSGADSWEDLATEKDREYLETVVGEFGLELP